MFDSELTVLFMATRVFATLFAISRSSCTSVPRLGVTVCVASAKPLASAKSRRFWAISAITMCSQPLYLATAAQSKPTAPAPTIRQVDLTFGCAFRTACTATASGSRSAPAEKEMESGNLSMVQFSGHGSNVSRTLTCDTTWQDDLLDLGVCPESEGTMPRCS